MNKPAKKVVGTLFSKTLWLARGTSVVMGLGVMLALVVGVASTALAGTGVGAGFDLDVTNTVGQITKLVGSVGGPSLQIDNNSTSSTATALDLQVESGKAPMKVNSGTKVANLSSDTVDGKSAGQIGVNGLEEVSSISSSNSDSPKSAIASCPAGKILVGTGYNVNGGKSGSSPNQETDVAVHDVSFSSTAVGVTAYEIDPTAANWSVTASGICATAP